MSTAGRSRPLIHSNGVLWGAFISALVINVALLLLIGGLISRRETRLASGPNLQPVDFIRIVPKQEEPKPSPPPEPKKLVDEPAAKSRADEGPKPRPGKPPKAPSAGRQPRAGKTTQGKAKTTEPGVAAPRIDIPEHGTGPAFNAVPGSDTRLTGPPAQWNPEKKPENGGNGGEANSEGGSGDQSLVVLSRVLPDYPARARAQEIEGWVRLEIQVTATGMVDSAKVVAASPEQIFDGAALEAIRRWRFKPAFKEGRAVAQRAVLMMKFRLRRH